MNLEDIKNSLEVSDDKQRLNVFNKNNTSIDK